MSEKFVVGKKYKGLLSQTIRECVFVSNDFVILRRSDGREIAFEKLSKDSLNHVEYVEPQKGEFWVNVYKHYIVYYPTKEKADGMSRNDRLACVKVPWTEGEGLEQTNK